MPRSRSDQNGRRPHGPLEGPLEDPASVLHEPVDLERSLLDEAELGTDVEPPTVTEREELEREADDADAMLEVESVLAPPPWDPSGDEDGPRELEAQLEAAGEPAEVLSLHGEELLAVEGPDEPGAWDGTGAGEPGAGVLEVPDTGETRALLVAERARLVALLTELEGEGLRQRSQRDDLSSLSAVDQHPADQGTETFDRARDLSLREQVEGELREVVRALKRLDDGSYGRCEACGRPIGVARLLAEPAARFCVKDQREVERQLAVMHREVEP